MTIKWGYFPNKNEQKEIIFYFKKYYDSYFIKFLENIFLYQKECHNIDEKRKKIIGYLFKNIMRKITNKINSLKLFLYNKK
ncbi:hypothetical protein AGMMS49546_34510 [Spirochaetia bacterium]|nr:hypothetical protein AGMMS49546_34510 [Spirochaetia bacterium]